MTKIEDCFRGMCTQSYGVCREDYVQPEKVFFPFDFIDLRPNCVDCVVAKRLQTAVLSSARGHVSMSQ